MKSISNCEPKLSTCIPELSTDHWNTDWAQFAIHFKLKQ